MNDAELLDETIPTDAVLHVHVGEGPHANLGRAARTMQAIERGEAVPPHFGVGFAEMGQMLSAFTPRRWELIAEMRRSGPSSVRALAQRLERDYKNVHGDVAALEQWMAVQRLPDGRVHVPWREIVMDMHLPRQMAA